MRAIYIGVGHDDDFVVAQLLDIKLISANARAKRRDQCANFLAAQHPVKPRTFHVQDLALERQNRLIGPRTALLGRPTGRVPLDQKQF